MSTVNQDKGLKGRLEDLALLDILQIIAFSRKTGYLTVEGPLLLANFLGLPRPELTASRG